MANVQNTQPEDAHQLQFPPGGHHELKDSRKGEAEHYHIEAHAHSRKCYGEDVIVVAKRVYGHWIVGCRDRVSSKELGLQCE